jgi:YD repeat-containing protein
MTTKPLSQSLLQPQMQTLYTRLATRLAIRLAWVAAALLPLLASTLAQAQSGSITRVSRFEYNTVGLLTKEVIEPDNTASPLCHATDHVYDGFGNKARVTSRACGDTTGVAAASPRTASTTYTTDGRFPQVTTNAAGHQETKQYDARFGLPTSLVGPNGLTTTWAYDGFGRKLRESRADGTWSRWQYNYCTDAGANCPTSLLAQGQGANQTSAPLAQSPVWLVLEQSCLASDQTNCQLAAPDKRQYHDALSRVIRVETTGFDGGAAAALQLVQDTEYNSLGQIRRKSNTYDKASPTSAVWVTYSYDALGRLIKEEAPDASASSGGIATTVISYNGLSSTITNSKGQSKTTTKDALGRTAQVLDAQGNSISYQYDALGQLIQTNAAGNITRIQYNLRGQKTRMDDPAMGVWTYDYNVFGELISQTDSLGQTSTIAYDNLGRMTSRSEPDLISTWVYDNCNKGKGKLCQASANNGYNRVHSYDSLGRPASTSTKLDTTATTSITYQTTSGRITSQTYPTGYKASYQYTALGFLKTITGQGATGTVAGFTSAVSYTIEAINAQGQITRYRYGNQVVTTKAYDSLTGRLQSITATKDGLATGGIQQNTYTYDALGNLTQRADINTGVQESFLYDNLNRLTNYSAIGGAVTSQNPSANVQVMYDSRGNILYKSDVGRYWYDPQRPNRLTNITLEAPAGGAALTGSRALAYAFDDYKAGARTLQSGLGPASGQVMGNGNLWYTVSQDNANGRHSIRWETYTSFNMPKQIALVSLGQAATSTAATISGSVCPADSTAQAGNPALCTTSAGLTINAVSTYSCPAGATLSGNRCFSNTITTSQVANRTLTFVYGPEHQRIRQTTALGANAPSTLSPGTVWYLNGENNNLSYEKDLKTHAAGSYTEHRHYLTAGGIVFAQHITRSGSLGTGATAKPKQPAP